MLPEDPLVIVQDEPSKYHFKTKDNQRVHIEHKDDDFIYLSLYKWGEEASLQIVLDKVPTHNHIFSENKIEVENPDFLLRVYPIDTRSTGDFYGDVDDMVQCHDGGLRFELVFKKKRPAMNNVFKFPLIAKNLRCAYQRFLTEQEIIEAKIIRPLNVEGSYAFYHISKKNNQYMTGKVFHLFRPIAEDALGNKAWCSLYINPEITELTITIPQQFLDEAIYPITLDPDFGYQIIGTAGAVYLAYTGASFRAGSAWPMPAGGGTANYLRAYLLGTVACDCKAFINQKDSGGAGTHGQIATKETLACAADAGHWEEFTLASEALTGGVDYILNVLGNGADAPGKGDTYAILYDDNGAVASYYEFPQNYGAPESPWVVNPEGTTLDYSIFCNYDVVAVEGGGGAGAVVMGTKSLILDLLLEGII